MTVSPNQAGEAAAERTPEEQAALLAEAKTPSDKQLDQAAAAAGPPPVAPDHTAGTPAGQEAAAQGGGMPPVSVPEGVTAGVSEALDANIVRHVDQRKGVISTSAWNASVALKIAPKMEWTDALITAIKSYQESIGQRDTGYLTRDQCRRLGLVYLD